MANEGMPFDRETDSVDQFGRITFHWLTQVGSWFGQNEIIENARGKQGRTASMMDAKPEREVTFRWRLFEGINRSCHIFEESWNR
jgi:hypothetical protein